MLHAMIPLRVILTLISSRGYLIYKSRKKILVVPTTGRPFVSPKFLLMDFKLKPAVIIATNGTTVCYPSTTGSVIQRADYKGVLYDVLMILSDKYGLNYTSFWGNSESTDINLASAHWRHNNTTKCHEITFVKNDDMKNATQGSPSWRCWSF